MKLIIVKPELHKFASCAEFAEAFKLGENDLVLTNEYIFNPYRYIRSSRKNTAPASRPTSWSTRSRRTR